MLKNRRLAFEELQRGNLYFSQQGEDVLIETLLGREKENGFYVDVGAFDPILYSNTHLFYKKGWSGINIEPNPEHYVVFPKWRSRDVNLNIAVSDTRSVVKFSCDGAYSGIKDNEYPFTNRNSSAQIVQVETLTLAEILERHLPKGKVIDFITIDCEGHDYRVLKSNDWSRYRPRIVLVEQHESKVKGDIYEYLTQIGYTFYCKLGVTLFFICREEAGRIFGPE